MSYIASLRASDPRKLSLRAIEELTGISHSRVADLLKGRMGSPSLYEFTTLCLLFGQRPSVVIERVMQTLEQQETTPAATKAFTPDCARRIELEETARHESDLAEATLKALESDPMSLAAYDDPTKQQYLEHGDPDATA